MKEKLSILHSRQMTSSKGLYYFRVAMTLFFGVVPVTIFCVRSHSNISIDVLIILLFLPGFGLIPPKVNSAAMW